MRAKGRTRPPLWPAVFATILLTASMFAVATGILDVVLPNVGGAESFAGFRAVAAGGGPAWVFGYVFFHNLGIATLVPGVGLVACAVEKDARRRRLAVALLSAAAILTLLTAAELVLRRGYWQVPIVLPLLALESAAVLLITWVGARSLRSHVPTPRPEWGWIEPAREIAPHVVIAAVALAFAAFVEVAYLSATYGL